jgi:hypothetical protein
MPQYPDESLPSAPLSLEEFTTTAMELLSGPNADLHAFVRFVLAGRLIGHDGLEQHVFVNAREGALVP